MMGFKSVAVLPERIGPTMSMWVKASLPPQMIFSPMEPPLSIACFHLLAQRQVNVVRFFFLPPIKKTLQGFLQRRLLGNQYLPLHVPPLHPERGHGAPVGEHPVHGDDEHQKKSPPCHCKRGKAKAVFRPCEVCPCREGVRDEDGEGCQ